jgi:ATP-dependent RNA helicase DeaD
MNIGRRQNADPRWILPLICRRGHITKTEVGAIRIGPNDTSFQVPRALAAKFQSAVARTAGGDDDVLIEASSGPPPMQRGSGNKGGRPNMPVRTPGKPMGKPKRRRD